MSAGWLVNTRRPVRGGRTSRLSRLLGASLALGLGGGALVAACRQADPPEVHYGLKDRPDAPCPGTCKELGAPGGSPRPDGWGGPNLFWSGKPSEAPSCSSIGMWPVGAYPRDDATEIYARDDFYSDLKPGGACPGCTCAPPQCAVPESVVYSMVSSDDPTWDRPGERCEAEVHYDARDGFEPTSRWDGSCLSHDAVPAAPLATAFVFASMFSIYCEPFESPAGLDALVGTLWRACDPKHFYIQNECTSSPRCMPPAPEGFRYCLARRTGKEPGDEDTPCPPSYPERSLVFSTIDGCDSCACTTVAQPECTVSLSRYRDPDCTDLLRTDEVLRPEDPLWSGSPRTCLEMPADGTVGGISATAVTRREGACEVTGGDQVAEPQLAEEHILCCEAASGG